MSRVKSIIRITKLVVTTTFSIIRELTRLVLPHLIQLFCGLFKEINKRLRFSITFKTTLTYTLLFTTILIILGTLLTCGFAYFLIYHANQELQKNNRLAADLIGENSDIPGEAIRRFAEIEMVSITLMDENSRVIFSTTPASLNNTSSERINLYGPISIDTSMGILYSDSTVNLGKGIKKITAGKNLFEEKIYLQGLVACLILAFALALLLMIMIGARTSRRMLRPINTMTRTARLISAGDLETRLDVVDSHDELKELAVTFNEMLDRIQTSFEKQEIFVSDASHELRTPISVIQGYANLLQRWGKDDQAVLEESLAAIKNESDYMKELVEKLLFLASADKKQQHLQTELFALDELAAEVLKESSLIDSGHIISGKISDIVMVDGDRALIKQALRIFVDNSIKYTPPGGSIMINCSIDRMRALIAIEDSGIGISADDLPLIFDRFYKVDKSRTRESGGVGLGLSIARWIIEQHQGEMTVESVKGKGTRISITLPAVKT